PGDKKGADSTWLVDALDHGVVIITECKAKKFMIGKNEKGTKRGQTCLGVISQVLNKGITKKLHIEAKVTISAGLGQFDDNYILEVPALAPRPFATLCPWESRKDLKERMMKYSRMANALRVLITVRASEVGTQRSDGQRFKCIGARKEEIDKFLVTVEAKDGPMSMVKV
ncbi:long-chain-alcohol oxidase FAO1-like protein, partial [Tanacetum coccineum]